MEVEEISGFALEFYRECFSDVGSSTNKSNTVLYQNLNILTDSFIAL
jgi:hypothetical protein